jgi:hypothetical protein
MYFRGEAGDHLENLLNVEMDLKWLLFPTALIIPIQCSRMKSSMPLIRDLVFQNTPLSKQPFKTQPQIENEDVT